MARSIRRAEISDIGAAQAGVVIDLFLSYRGAKAYDRMIDLYRAMDRVIHTPPWCGSNTLSRSIAQARRMTPKMC